MLAKTTGNNITVWKMLRPLIALLTFALALPAQAGLIATAGVSGSQQGTVTDSGVLIGNTAYASVRDASGTTATASATYGIVKVTTAGAISSGSSNGGAQASFQDALQLSNGALNGKQGRLTLAYYFDYTAFADASGSGFANGSLSFQSWAGNSYSWYLDYLNTDTGGYTMYEYRDPAGQGRVYNVPRTNYLYVTTDFTWGGLVSTGFQIQSSVGSYTPQNAIGTAQYNFDAGHSGYWAGVVSATTDGQVITDYELSSLSGTDYSESLVPSNQVPEPGTPAVLLLGLALFGLQRSRRR